VRRVQRQVEGGQAQGGEGRLPRRPVVLHAHRARREQRHNRLDQGARREVLQGGYLPRLHCEERVQWPRKGQLTPPDRLQEGLYFSRVFD